VTKLLQLRTDFADLVGHPNSFSQLKVTALMRSRISLRNLPLLLLSPLVLSGLSACGSPAPEVAEVESSAAPTEAVPEAVANMEMTADPSTTDPTIEEAWDSIDLEGRTTACEAWTASGEAFFVSLGDKIIVPSNLPRSAVEEFYNAECGPEGPAMDMPEDISDESGWAVLTVVWRSSNEPQNDTMCLDWTTDRSGTAELMSDNGVVSKEAVETFYDGVCDFDPNVIQPGTYLVPEEISPGQYRTDDSVNGGSCYMSQDVGDDIVNNLREDVGRPVFTVEDVPNSTFSINSDCGTVSKLDRG